MGGGKSHLYTEKSIGSPADKATCPSVNHFLSYSYLPIPRFLPLTVSHTARRFFYVKNQTAGVCVNPSDAFSLPSNDFREPANDLRESANDLRAPANHLRAPARDFRAPADDFRASLNDFRWSLTVFASPFRGKRRPQIILGSPQMILGRPQIISGIPQKKKRCLQLISGILRKESGLPGMKPGQGERIGGIDRKKETGSGGHTAVPTIYKRQGAVE
jgi:hypothetical protein